jgi:hypothetical protein
VLLGRLPFTAESMSMFTVMLLTVTVTFTPMLEITVYKITLTSMSVVTGYKMMVTVNSVFPPGHAVFPSAEGAGAGRRSALDRLCAMVRKRAASISSFLAFASNLPASRRTGRGSWASGFSWALGSSGHRSTQA